VRERFQPGYNHYNVSKLVGDASSRQYYRYVTDDGDSYILAAYPEPFDTSSFSYRQIYDLLQEIAIPVPEIIAIDSELGIVLQEDLGNESLQKTLRNADDRQKGLLLKEAIGHILTIQEKGTQALKPEYEGYGLAFDEEKLNWEFRFFARHYLFIHRVTLVAGNAFSRPRLTSLPASDQVRLPDERTTHGDQVGNTAVNHTFCFPKAAYAAD